MWSFFCGRKRLLRGLVLALCSVVLAACETIGYYAQSVAGQGQILSKRRPIADILVQKNVQPELRAILATVSRIRDYATHQLGLPASQSFRGYVALDGPYVVWSVVAAPKFSLIAKKWCYPIIGCASYRGYFSQAHAEQYAAELKASGLEVSVSGVPAYSTLGWFADPIYSPILKWSEARIARLIFHELAHEQLYIMGDSDFNEAFASAVAEIGVRRWLRVGMDLQAMDRYFSQERREAAVYGLLQRAAEELKSIYQADRPEDWKEKAKKEVLARLSDRYHKARDSDWAGYKGYEHWFIPPPNNARLASIGTYRRYLPAFRALYRQVNKDLTEFYRVVAVMGEQPQKARTLQMESLLDLGQGPNVVPDFYNPHN